MIQVYQHSTSAAIYSASRALRPLAMEGLSVWMTDVMAAWGGTISLVVHSTVWVSRIINGGRQGFPALQTFGSKDCKLCKVHVTRGKRIPIHPVTAVKMSDAPYIVVMETHFMSPWQDHSKMESGMWGMEPHLKQALHNFIKLAAWHGAQHVPKLRQVAH